MFPIFILGTFVFKNVILKLSIKFENCAVENSKTATTNCLRMSDLAKCYAEPRQSIPLTKHHFPQRDSSTELRTTFSDI